MGTNKRYRYPGINFFTKDDADIFCGRKEDAEKLFSRIMLNNTVVLHGDSGTGKSSLVQAGLIPLLEAQNELSLKQGRLQYLPVTIRFDSLSNKKIKDDPGIKNREGEDPEILSRQIYQCLDKYRSYQANELPYIGPQQDSLWYTAKLFERNNYTLLLILDQFEELQGYTHAQTEAFGKKLSELFVSIMPDTIYAEYDKETAKVSDQEMSESVRKKFNEDIKFLEQPLNVRILFIVREDKLGTMSLLADYFPNILKNDFFLLPLVEKGARQAIIGPAQTDGDFETNKFTFDQEAEDHLLQVLRESDLYDPIQLQIVCSNIERTIAVNKEKITKNDIPEVGYIIKDFYDKSWKGIDAEYNLTREESERTREAVIKELVVSGSRNLVLEKELLNVLNDVNPNDDSRNQGIIRSLHRDGLLRKVPAGKDTYYQLSHDRLMAPLTEDQNSLKAARKAKDDVQKEKDAQELKVQKEREAQELKAKKTKTRLTLGAAVLVVIICALAYFNKTREERKSEEARYRLISTSLLRAGNPTLAYIIARDWLEKKPHSKDFEKYVSDFDSSNYVYLTGMYPGLSEEVSPVIYGDSTLIITDNKTRSFWNIKEGGIDSIINIERSTDDNIPFRRLTTTKGEVDLFRYEDRFGHEYDTVVVVDGTGKELTTVMSWNTQNIAISPDSNYLLLGSELFNLKSFKKIGQLPGTDAGVFKQSSSIFVDNNHLAAAYESGNIEVFKIDESKSKTRVESIYSFKAKNNTYSTINMMAIAIGGEHKYLLAANDRNSIDVFKQLPDTVDQIGELKGHRGLINCMSVSSNGKLLLTGSTDRTAILWNLDSLQKIAVMKAPNSSDINQVGFFNNDKSMVTSTNAGVVYTWRSERPSELYNKNQLYRFSPLNYKVLGLDEIKAGIPRTIRTTTDLYYATLNYLLNVPQINDYPDDKSYSENLKSTISSLKKMYYILINGADYREKISDLEDALLDKCYYAFLYNELDLLNIPYKENSVEQGILNAKFMIPEWKMRFLDLTLKETAKASTEFNSSSPGYFEDEKDYKSYLRLISFYKDSVWQHLQTRYGNNDELKSLKRTIDESFIKYYIYTQKTDSAIKAAYRISKEVYEPSDNRLNLVIAYLGAERYSDAKKTYEIIKDQLNSDTKVALKNTLDLFRERNIAVASIDSFYKEFSLYSAAEPGY